jgi:tripartite-type tricarboxylate transporter receptor subunit TctC
MRSNTSKRILPGVSALALALASWNAQAQGVGDFYKGRTIELITGGTPGSVYDNWSRALGRYFTKYLPGNPNVIIRNMPGGGHITATNHIYNQSPRDGTVLGLVSRNMPIAELLGTPMVKFKSAEFNWIGSPELTNRVCMASSSSAVSKAEDLYTTELLTAGSGAGSAVSTTPVLLNKLLGMKFKLVEGYQGGPEIFLAMDRGEVNGLCQTLAAVESTVPGAIQKGRVKVLFNMESKPLPGLGAPSIYQFTKTEEQRQIIAFYNSNAELGRPLMTTPGVPKERLEALRQAFNTMMKDPEFIVEVKKSTGSDVRPLTGEEVEAVARRIASTPKHIVDKTIELVGKLGE